MLNGNSITSLERKYDATLYCLELYSLRNICLSMGTKYNYFWFTNLNQRSHGGKKLTSSNKEKSPWNVEYIGIDDIISRSWIRIMFISNIPKQYSGEGTHKYSYKYSSLEKLRVSEVVCSMPLAEHFKFVWESIYKIFLDKATYRKRF